MKCPWREIRETETINIMGDKVVVKTDFAECYKEECPCYVPEWSSGGQLGNFVIPEYCKRVELEAKK